MTARVLVVDDDPAVRSAVSRALRVDYDEAEAADV
jgi:CheY-like chemotaxis protein